MSRPSSLRVLIIGTGAVGIGLGLGFMRAHVKVLYWIIKTPPSHALRPRTGRPQEHGHGNRGGRGKQAPRVQTRSRNGKAKRARAQQPATGPREWTAKEYLKQKVLNLQDSELDQMFDVTFELTQALRWICSREKSLSMICVAIPKLAILDHQNLAFISLTRVASRVTEMEIPLFVYQQGPKLIELYEEMRFQPEMIARSMPLFTSLAETRGHAKMYNLDYWDDPSECFFTMDISSEHLVRWPNRLKEEFRTRVGLRIETRPLISLPWGMKFIPSWQLFDLLLVYYFGYESNRFSLMRRDMLVCNTTANAMREIGKLNGYWPVNELTFLPRQLVILLQDFLRTRTGNLHKFAEEHIRTRLRIETRIILEEYLILGGARNRSMDALESLMESTSTTADQTSAMGSRSLTSSHDRLR